ncbi:hypothetical protein Rhopal_004793-T1 [Rhodotorula paludigena]|uniref:Uncharacterized protein n=1 Tax=Rhodotorula paludigena TaxID=86838 RepID=A0AAV5GQH8_9BASI|nr:hypothetical protein Rhopal_004793-T1 [Rhodotorula paludigena]
MRDVQASNHNPNLDDGTPHSPNTFLTFQQVRLAPAGKGKGKAPAKNASKAKPPRANSPTLLPRHPALPTPPGMDPADAAIARAAALAEPDRLPTPPRPAVPRLSLPHSVLVDSEGSFSPLNHPRSHRFPLYALPSVTADPAKEVAPLPHTPADGLAPAPLGSAAATGTAAAALLPLLPILCPTQLCLPVAKQDTPTMSLEDLYGLANQMADKYAWLRAQWGSPDDLNTNPAFSGPPTHVNTDNTNTLSACDDLPFRSIPNKIGSPGCPSSASPGPAASPLRADPPCAPDVGNERILVAKTQPHAPDYDKLARRAAIATWEAQPTIVVCDKTMHASQPEADADHPVQDPVQPLALRSDDAANDAEWESYWSYPSSLATTEDAPATALASCS